MGRASLVKQKQQKGELAASTAMRLQARAVPVSLENGLLE